MNASAIRTSAHSAKTWLATAAGHTLSKDVIPGLNLNQFAYVVLGAFLYEIFNWLDKNPMPLEYQWRSVAVPAPSVTSTISSVNQNPAGIPPA